MKSYKEVVLKEAESILKSEPYLRLGQVCYNLSHTMFPEIVDSLRGTAIDCFNDDSVITLFLERIEKVITDNAEQLERIKKDLPYKTKILEKNEKSLDWRLPTKSELNLMYENLYKIKIGNFASAWYWSSSEYYANRAWLQSFFNGVQSNYSKGYYSRVRLVRTFESNSNYFFRDETENGFIFDVQGTTFYECKKEDEVDEMNWYEAMQLRELQC